MTGTPRLFPSLRTGKACGNCLLPLIGILYLHIPGDPVADAGVKFLLQLWLYQEGDLFKARFPGVVQGKINDNVPLLVHGVDLLQTAVAASQSCRHNYKFRFFLVSFHNLSLFCLSEF